MRIASLFPAATEILFALGLGDDIVGVSHECAYPAEASAKPRIIRTVIDQEQISSGDIDHRVRAAVEQRRSLYACDIPLLQALKPDVLVTQSLCAVCALDDSGAGKIVQSLEPRPDVLTLHAHTLEELFLEIRLLGHRLNRNQEAGCLVSSLVKRIEEVEERVVSEKTRPTVACIEWMDPLMVAGHWVPEMISLAGGKDILGSVGEPSRYINWDELVAAQPGQLILMPCGFPIERTRKELALLTQHPQWNMLAAVKEGHVWLVDGPSLFNCPGPRLVQGIELLASIFHPRIFGHQALAGFAEQWTA